MHYEDKKTGFKFDAVSGVPKENTVEAFEELFSANKAAQEGELPALPEPYGLLEFESEIPGDLRTVAGYCADDMKEYARQAISADRASRQVANKAEVEPVAASIDTTKFQSLMGGILDAQTESENLGVSDPYDSARSKLVAYINQHVASQVRAALATPPATTGGANATPTGAMPKDLAIQCLNELDVDSDVHAALSKFIIEGGATSASTILTDERIDWLAIKCGVETREVPQEFIRNFAREVAAQAGQVAVPGWISVDERLPDSGYCLATYRNRHGKLRIIRAKYARQYEIDAGEDAIDQGNCEYNEADDTFYLNAGWLECIDNWDEYSSIYVTEGEVTHWMPLPATPSPAKESK